jgi:hypothetical protein
VAEQLQQDQFSANMVLSVLVLLLWILFERAAYRLRSMELRLLLQYVACVVLHVSCWWVIPTLNQQNFVVKVGLVFFYLLQCTYLAFGAAQLREGFVVFPLVPSTVTKYGSGMIPGMVFKVYLAIPFLFEMKSILDWWCTKTSIDVFMWLQMEEIYAQLFKNACEMSTRRRDFEVVQGQTKQPLVRKMIYGGLIFGVLFLILVGPLVLFSGINPSLAANPLYSVNFRVNLVGSSGQPLVVYESVDAGLDSTDANGIFIDNPLAIIPSSVYQFTLPTVVQRNQLTLQLSTFQRTSPVPWVISAPFIKVLAEDFGAAEGNYGRWLFQFTAKRLLPVSAQEVSWNTEVAITKEQAGKLLVLLNVPNLELDVDIPNVTSVIVPNAYYPGVKLTPASSDATFDGCLGSRPLNVSLSRTRVQDWWSVSIPDVNAPEKCADSSTPQYEGTSLLYEPNCEELLIKMCDASGDMSQNCQIKTRYQKDNVGGICSVISSQPAVPDIGASLGIESYGVTALYVFILVTIGSAVRGALLGSTSNIIYSEMPEPQDLIDLCEGIYIIRLQGYDGHLRDEVRLFETLTKLYRSPEMLMRMTGTDGLNLPPPRLSSREARRLS